MRYATLGLVALFLTGCSSDSGSNDLARAIRAEIFSPSAPTEASEGGDLTREIVDQLGVAMIEIRVPTFGFEAAALATYANDDKITYLTTDNRSLVMRGGLVASTHGLGFDLAPIAILSDDPISRVRPIARWPMQVKRRYQFDGRGPLGTQIVVSCQFSVGDSRTIEILDNLHEVVEIREICLGGDQVAFTNVHKADRVSGFIWQSRQWTGQNQKYIRYDVLEPLEL